MSSFPVLHGDDASAFAELSRVTLRVDQRTRDGHRLPRGSSGTVVEVLKDGQAYMVEFARPVRALVTVAPNDVIAAPEG